ncbi:MarR family transcriptional regulator [Nonomuraea fuscirosea]|uniref:DNA-binding MarR family transcriptional regulator n=1 Tax=Nonomuraea fuscirosea TaxID=1291556 RepID=A0A2T0N7Z4_9ACTN|nr:MarR family transcriptional regulator [Nonomuraea fuscirosea]PRX68655.1 DNA-binding MarR family transcriptional regulator [Nonomuraea fuscirosea]
MDGADELRWLDEDEQAAWTTLVSVLLTLPGALDAQLQADAGMTLYEYLVLSGLTYAPEGTMRLSDLALVTNGSQSRLSQVATKLERRGWLVRQRDPDDGRSTLAVLTPAGRAKVDQTSPGHVETVRRLIFDPLTAAQVRQMREINRRIRTAVDPNGSVMFRAHGV